MVADEVYDVTPDLDVTPQNDQQLIENTKISIWDMLHLENCGVTKPTKKLDMKFVQLLAKRRVAWRRRAKPTPYKAAGLHLKPRKRRNWMALCVQAGGEEADKPCTQCAGGHGLWERCILPGLRFERVTGGACACCFVNGRARWCSLRKTPKHARSPRTKRKKARSATLDEYSPSDDDTATPEQIIEYKGYYARKPLSQLQQTLAQLGEVIRDQEVEGKKIQERLHHMKACSFEIYNLMVAKSTDT